MSRNRPLFAAALLAVSSLCGCRGSAPMHVWAPPRLQSAAGQRVVLAEIMGPEDDSRSLSAAMRESKPGEPSRQVVLVDQSSLQQRSPIQLTSANGDVPSDVALLHAARNQGMDLLLFGEILHRHTTGTATVEPIPGIESATEHSEAGGETPRVVNRGPGANAFSVSWRIQGVRDSTIVGGMPVTVSGDTIRAEHPDLLPMLETDPDQALILAAARDSWRLLTPYVRTVRCALAEPYLLAGSSRVREANTWAAEGRWDKAERQWRQVFNAHPSNHAALHNLALAAAARQDFVVAKRLAQQALEAHRSNLYEQTVVWIEQRQLELTRAFHLPPPPDGWLFSSEP